MIPINQLPSALMPDSELPITWDVLLPPFVNEAEVAINPSAFERIHEVGGYVLTVVTSYKRFSVDGDDSSMGTLILCGKSSGVTSDIPMQEGSFGRVVRSRTSEEPVAELHLDIDLLQRSFSRDVLVEQYNDSGVRHASNWATVLDSTIKQTYREAIRSSRSQESEISLIAAAHCAYLLRRLRFITTA